MLFCTFPGLGPPQASSQMYRNPAGDYVEHRREDQTESGHADHAGEHRSTKRLAQFGARSHCPDQRRNAENKGKRGHQDRPQSQVCRFNCGIERIAAAVFELFGEFDNQNGVFGRKADEHHEPDLSENIVVLTA